MKFRKIWKFDLGSFFWESASHPIVGLTDRFQVVFQVFDLKKKVFKDWREVLGVIFNEEPDGISGFPCCRAKPLAAAQFSVDFWTKNVKLIFFNVFCI